MFKEITNVTDQIVLGFVSPNIHTLVLPNLKFSVDPNIKPGFLGFVQIAAKGLYPKYEFTRYAIVFCGSLSPCFVDYG